MIRDVLRTPGIDCFDGPIRVEPRYRVLRADEVAGFVATQLVADDRRLPIIAVPTSSADSGTRLDLNELTKVLAGFAHVIVVERPALPVLGKAISSLSLAPGSARLWWPGLELDDDPSGHPTWTGPYDDPAVVVRSLTRRILSVSRDRWREPGRFIGFNRDVRRRREDLGRAAAERVVEEIQRLRTAAATDRERAEAKAPPTELTARQATDYEARLEAISADVAEVSDELERQRIAVEEAVSDWIESEEAKERLEREKLALQGRLEGMTAQLQQQALAAGAELESETDAFARAVRESWVDRLTVQDRDQHTLMTFTIREDLLSSVTAAGADRQKVVDTVMEVACGLARSVPGRQLHRLRAGSSGNAPDRMRASDGALAWRCNIQTNSASARRLHYWSCPNGTLEFVSVSVHDDFLIID